MSSSHADVAKSNGSLKRRPLSLGKARPQPARARARGPAETTARRRRGRPVKFAPGVWKAEGPQLQEQAARSGPRGGVLLLLTEQQALQVLLHFGEPDVLNRREPQQLLAIPCPLCRPLVLQAAAAQAFDARLQALASKLRPDVQIVLRDELARLALNDIGSDMWSLESHCVLASLSMPFSLEEVSASRTEQERRLKGELCSQPDLKVTTCGQRRRGESSDAETASRALREKCRVSIADWIWDEEVQLAARRRLGVGIPLHFTDILGARIVVLLLTEDAPLSKQGTLLCIGQARSTPSTPSAPAASVNAPHSNETNMIPAPGLTIRPGWYCFRSRSTGKVYYWNEETKQTTFEAPLHETPLPPGWTCQVSSNSGRVYYFNAEMDKSTFEFPCQ